MFVPIGDLGKCVNTEEDTRDRNSRGEGREKGNGERERRRAEEARNTS